MAAKNPKEAGVTPKVSVNFIGRSLLNDQILESRYGKMEGGGKDLKGGIGERKGGSLAGASHLHFGREKKNFL